MPGEPERANGPGDIQHPDLVEITNDIIYTATAEGVISYCSPQISRYGYSPEEVVGRHFSELVHPDDLERIGEEFGETMTTGREFVSRFRLLAKDGTPVWMEDFGRVVKEGGRITGLAGVLRDITERMRGERELERYRAMAESAHDAIFFKDPDGRYTYVNASALQILGLPKKEVIGKTDHDILSRPEEAARNVQSDREVFETRESGRVTKRMTSRDGKEYWCQVVKVPQFDESGELTGLVGIARDVTERRRVEEALRESEAKFKAMIESIGDHMSMMDRDLNILWVNEKAKRVFGGDLIGRKCYEVYHRRTEPCEPYPCITLKAFRDGQIHEHDTAVIGKDGKPIHFHCTANVALRDEKGRPTSVIEISRDVTERKRAEQGLRRYEAMVESAQDAIFFKDMESRYVVANAKTLDVFGLPRKEVIGKSDYEMMADREEARRNVDDDQRVFRTGEPAEIVKHMTRHDGQEYWLQAVKVPQFDGAGNLVGLVGVARDVTEQKRLEERLRSLAAEMSVSEERERRRIAAELHDQVGQDLVLSTLKLEALMESAGASPELEQIHDSISRAIRSLRTLTFEISPPVLSELGLEPALEWLAERFEEQHGLQISFQDDGQPKPLSEEVAGLLFQATRELLTNVARHAQADKVNVSVHRHSGRVRIKVEDDGRGFDASSALRPEGAEDGYGLFSISERLGYLGGSVEIDSQLGRGSRVVLLVPLQPERDSKKGEDR